MKRQIALSLALLLFGCALLSSCQTTGNTTSSTVSMPTPLETEPTEYVSPAETPATWSDFDVDTSWKEDDPMIHLSSDNSQTQWNGAKLYGKDLYIKQPGTYILSGKLEGQLFIAVNKEDKVHLVFNGLHIVSGNLSPILCERADKVVITLVDGTENMIEDIGKGYVSGATAADGRNAGAIHAKMGLTINGTGSLTVKTTYRHGIVSNSNLRIISGNISVDAVEEGIKGKESVSIRGGKITICSKDDGIKVNDEQKEGAGFFAMEGGTISIDTDADGIDVTKNVRIVGGELTVKSKDHAIATAGTFSTAASPILNLDAFSGSDDSDAKGIKADGEVTVDGGTIRITRSYEGIESKTAAVRIKNGVVEVVSSNDGVNASALLSVEGGTLYVRSSGDCLDSGGDIRIDGGTVILCGSSSNAFAPMDVPDGSQILVNGGTLLAYGSLAEVQFPSENSSQGFLCATETMKKDSSYAIKDQHGNVVCAFTVHNDVLTLCYSSDRIQKEGTYTLYSDAKPMGDPLYCLYSKAVSGQVSQTITAQ